MHKLDLFKLAFDTYCKLDDEISSLIRTGTDERYLSLVRERCAVATEMEIIITS